MASEQERQKALTLLFSKDVQHALEITGYAILNEAHTLSDEDGRKAYSATLQQLAQARALLEEFSAPNRRGKDRSYYFDKDGYHCVYCSLSDILGHNEDCPVVKARAFLMEHSADPA